MSVKMVLSNTLRYQEIKHMGTASVAVTMGFMFVQGQTIVHADTVEATAKTSEETCRREERWSRDDKQFMKLP